MAGETVKQVQQNYVVHQARLCADPDLKFTPSGTAVLELRVACNRRYKKPGTDDWQDQSSYWGVVVWGEQAQRLAERLHKGSPVLVEGELRSRSWETKDGKKQSVVYVHARRVADMERHSDAGNATAEQRQASAEPDLTPDAEVDRLLDDSDIPF